MDLKKASQNTILEISSDPYIGVYDELKRYIN